MQVILVGEADVLHAVLHREAGQTQVAGALGQGMARLVGARGGVGPAHHATDAGQVRMGAGPQRLARIGVKSQAVFGEGGGDARGIGQQVFAHDQLEPDFAPRLQGQKHRQHHVEVLVDVDQHHQRRGR